MTRGMVIVETRKQPGLNTVLMNHYKYTKWPILVVHGPDNGEYVRSAAKFLPDVRFMELTENINSAADYNELLTSTWFWLNIEWEKVLIFQHDSLLLRSGIEQYLQYDYIGAPWKFQNHGGNGGLSLRTVNKMTAIISQTPYFAALGNEDVYFSNLMSTVEGKLASRELCSTFSVESIFALGTFGLHAIDKYLSTEECIKILNQYY